MTAPSILAVLGAIAISMSSALFGVGIARVLWADDLKHARAMDEIRSRTEVSLRKTIDILQQLVDSKK